MFESKVWMSKWYSRFGSTLFLLWILDTTFRLRHVNKMVSDYFLQEWLFSCPGDDPAVVNIGLKINGVGSMDLMNGQSSSVNIAATASEVRITKISYWILKTVSTLFFKNAPKCKFFF